MSAKKSRRKGNQQYYNGAKYKGTKCDGEGLGYNVFDNGKANSQNQFNKTFEAIISRIG